MFPVPHVLAVPSPIQDTSELLGLLFLLACSDLRRFCLSLHVRALNFLHAFFEDAVVCHDPDHVPPTLVDLFAAVRCVAGRYRFVEKDICCA